jgi:hypothetical protein
MYTNIKSIINSDNYVEDYIQNIEYIIRDYSMNELAEELNKLDYKKLKHLKESLSTKLIELHEWEDHSLVLKYKRGPNKNKNTANDIYKLSHFYLDFQIVTIGKSFDELYDVKVQPTKYFNLIKQANVEMNNDNEKTSFDEIKKLLLQLSTDNANMKQDIQANTLAVNREMSAIRTDMALNNKKTCEQILELKKDIDRIDSTMNKSRTTLINSTDAYDHTSVQMETNGKKRKKCTSTASEANGINKVWAQKSNLTTAFVFGKKNPVEQSESTQKKPKTIIIGTNTNIVLCQAANSANSLFQVYMGRVSNTVETNNIIKLLHDLQLKISDFRELANKHQKFKSFAFSIPSYQKSIIYNPTNWPEGIIVNKYTIPRSEPNNIDINSKKKFNQITSTPAVAANTARTNNLIDTIDDINSSLSGTQ